MMEIENRLVTTGLKDPPDIKEYWLRYEASLPPRGRPTDCRVEAACAGNNDITDGLIQLYLERKKTEDEKQYVDIQNEKILLVGKPERYVNHSCHPNTKLGNFCDIAIRDIYEGEEITADYNNFFIPAGIFRSHLHFGIYRSDIRDLKAFAIGDRLFCVAEV